MCFVGAIQKLCFPKKVVGAASSRCDGNKYCGGFSSAPTNKLLEQASYSSMRSSQGFPLRMMGKWFAGSQKQ